MHVELGFTRPVTNLECGRLLSMMRKGLFVCLAIVMCSPLSYGLAQEHEARQYFRDGYLAATAREWDAAISLYTRAAEQDPSNPEIYLQRAAAHQMAGDIDSAIGDYEKALQLKPDYYLALEYLAKLCEIKGDYDRAVNLYSRALPLVPDAKWRSVIKWWISQAKTKSQRAGDDQDDVRRPRSGHRSR